MVEEGQDTQSDTSARPVVMQPDDDQGCTYSEFMEQSSNDSCVHKDREQFLTSLKLLDVDYLICLRLIIKFEQGLA